MVENFLPQPFLHIVMKFKCNYEEHIQSKRKKKDVEPEVNQ